VELDALNDRPPRLSLVVTTVGRRVPFARLVRSLEGSTRRHETELVVVDQSPDGSCAAWLAEEQTDLAWRSTSSPPGASAGRNAGLRLARGDIVGFPDDDCWYEPDTAERVLARFDTDPDLMLLSGRALTADGRRSMLRWPDRPAPITESNHYRTIIAFSLFVRRAVLPQVGVFDEAIGTGSLGWYGAGEESDLVLRLLAAGHAGRYDPEIVVHHDEPRDRAGPELVAKMLRYGCGQGHLWRAHRTAPGHVGYRIARKLAGAGVNFVRGRWTRGRADLAFVHGCLAGLRDRSPRALRTLASTTDVTLARAAADEPTTAR
jgi:GT2 family glycosyltransferase